MSDTGKSEEAANTAREDERAQLIAEIESRKAGAARPGMLPGIALIGIWMMVLALFGVISALNGRFSGAGAEYVVLTICTMIVTGVLGMLMLRRWGWALVLGAALLATTVYLYNAVTMHIMPLYIMGALHLVFFLYLIRPEVRERMR